MPSKLKLMVTIAWNPQGFHLLDAFSKGSTFNAEYYHSNILTELLPLRPQVDGRRLVIHADSARLHITRKCRAFCKENRLCLAIHPPYCPDLAPSNFVFVGHAKHCLHGIAFPSQEKLLAPIHEIVWTILRPTLDDVFPHWMEGLEWIFQNNGDYYP
jgi:transposase